MTGSCVRRETILKGPPRLVRAFPRLSIYLAIYLAIYLSIDQVQPPDCCRGLFYQARGTYNSTIRLHPGPARRRPRQKGQRSPARLARLSRLWGDGEAIPSRTWTKGRFVHA